MQAPVEEGVQQNHPANGTAGLLCDCCLIDEEKSVAVSFGD